MYNVARGQVKCTCNVSALDKAIADHGLFSIHKENNEEHVNNRPKVSLCKVKIVSSLKIHQRFVTSCTVVRIKLSIKVNRISKTEFIDSYMYIHV